MPVCLYGCVVCLHVRVSSLLQCVGDFFGLPTGRLSRLSLPPTAVPQTCAKRLNLVVFTCLYACPFFCCCLFGCMLVRSLQFCVYLSALACAMACGACFQPCVVCPQYLSARIALACLYACIVSSGAMCSSTYACARRCFFAVCLHARVHVCSGAGFKL